MFLKDYLRRGNSPCCFKYFQKMFSGTLIEISYEEIIVYMAEQVVLFLHLRLHWVKICTLYYQKIHISKEIKKKK